ncbi:diguanylate cyclase [Fontimonas sp. SYSU GA230001]|uniref:sensor domain-containing diguanylate cyclase n=1 Tax=Fontimonas sp. SYSU GA230001 TaxID=3142450 RepID=UPI0032B4E8CB
MRTQRLDFAIAVLDSLAAHIAVLDMDGRIVAVNQAWSRFSRCNGGEAGRSYVGSNYIEVCESAARDGGDPIARSVLDGIQAMRGGERDEVTLEYPCNSPDQERWFILRVTRCEHDGAQYLIVSHDDITARRLAEAAVRRTEQTLRSVLEALPVGVWLMDRGGRISYGNPAGQRIWAGARYVPPEQFGEYKGWWRATGEPIAADEWAAARAIQKGETSIDEEIRIQCFDGSSKIILNSAIPLREPSGAISGAIIVNQDITARTEADEALRLAKAEAEAANAELQKALAREQQMARTDELTGAHNRRHFYDLARQSFDVAHRYQRALSIIVLDVDHFKDVNDRLGHEAGDRALQHLVNTVRPLLRGPDVFARYGGEEFVVLLPDTRLPQAEQVAERIRRAVAETEIDPSAPGFRITISAGVTALGFPGDSLDAMMRRADAALYAAKAAGRDCVRLAAA